MGSTQSKTFKTAQGSKSITKYDSGLSLNLCKHFLEPKEVDYARLVTFCNENDVKELSLFGNSLPVLSESVKGFTTITNLNLGCNTLLHPPSVLSLMKLTRLDLSGNGLTSFDASLLSLKSLVLSRNKLTSFPCVVANLPNLESLELDENQISSLAGIDTLSFASLKSLNLSSNALDDQLAVALLVFLLNNCITSLAINYNRISLATQSLLQQFVKVDRANRNVALQWLCDRDMNAVNAAMQHSTQYCAMRDALHHGLPQPIFEELIESFVC